MIREEVAPREAALNPAGVSPLQIKPYNIYVTVAYPPDTDTPGLAQENKTKVNSGLPNPPILFWTGSLLSVLSPWRPN